MFLYAINKFLIVFPYPWFPCLSWNPSELWNLWKVTENIVVLSSMGYCPVKFINMCNLYKIAHFFGIFYFL